MTLIIESLNAWGARFAGFALPMLLQSAVLIALLFALDLALRNRARATIRYAVWMLVLVKLALPPSLASPTGAAYWLPTAAAARYSAPAPALAPVPDEMLVDTTGAVRELASSDTGLPRISWQALFLVVWLAVASGMGIWAFCRLRLVAGVIRQSQEAPEAVRALLESCRRQLGIKRLIPARCAAIGSPAICGLSRPLILIPHALAANLGQAEMRAVLLHELAHHKRGDLWVNQAQIFLQIAYWYNPLVWLANARIRRAREQAVDEMALVELGVESPAYPTTLLHVAKLGLGRPVAALGLMGILEPGRGLSERILHIVNRPLPRTARIGARGLAAVLLLALVALPMACRRTTAPAPQPPASKSAQPNAGADKDAMILTITKEGTMVLRNNLVTLDNLQEKLAETTRVNSHATLTIRADRETTWTVVAKVLDASRAAHINIATSLTTATPHSDWSGKQLRGPGFMPPPGMLSPADVDALEAKLVEDPEDFSARRDLLAYYGFRDRAATAKHLLWIIEHHPEFSGSGPGLSLNPVMEESAYRQGKSLWLQNVKNNPTNAVILGNAAAYFLLADRATAEDLLKKAQVLDPKNPAWSEHLGQLYKLDMNGHPGTNLPAKALAEFEKAQSQTSPAVPGAPRLVDLAQMAVAAGDLEKARTYAAELLGPGMQWSGGGNAGRAFFYGNLVLGRVALREGKLDEAKEYLLEAGKTKGEPSLNSFGPNMSLAKELLDKGETNAVLEFFQECERFWPQYAGKNKMAEWTAELKEGKTPDFGANLFY